MKSAFAIAAVAALAVSAAAQAQAQAVTATLATPLPKPRRLVVESTVWNCAESECKVVVGAEAVSWQACKALVRIVGPVSAYSGLDADKLARCNAK
jgi:hypothetical protein